MASGGLRPIKPITKQVSFLPALITAQNRSDVYTMSGGKSKRQRKVMKALKG